MVNRCERGLTIDLRFAGAQEIKIRTMHHKNTSHCLSSSLTLYGALALQTPALQIAQPLFKLRRDLVLSTTYHRRGALPCPAVDSTLRRRSWPIPTTRQFLFYGAQTLLELMITGLLLG
jgi:hypothetical protein